MKATPKLTILSIVFLLFTFYTTPPLPAGKPVQEDAVPSLDSLYQQAIRLKNMLKYDSATMLLQQVGPNYREREQWALYLECQYHLSHCLWANHNSAKAVALSEEMIQLCQEQLGPDHITLAGFYTILGNVHADRRSKEDYEKCLTFFHRALEITRSHYGEQHSALAGAYERLGIARYLINDYADAIPYYEKALTYLEPPTPQNAYAYYKIHLNTGLSYYGMGHFEKALHHFQQSRYYLSDVLQQKDGRYVKTSINIAEVLIQLGKVDEALFTLEAIRELEEEVVEPGNKLKVYFRGCLGESYEAKGDYAKAIGFYQQCLAYWDPEKRDDINGLVLEYTRIGSSYSKLNQYQSAEDHFQQAISLLADYYDADNYTWVEPLLQLGINCQKKRNFKEGREYLLRALSITSEKMGKRHPTLGKIQTALARSYFEEGQLYTDSPDFVSSQDSLAGLIKDVADPNAQAVSHFSWEKQMLRSLGKAYHWAEEAQQSFLMNESEVGIRPSITQINDLAAFVDVTALKATIKTAQYRRTKDIRALQQAEDLFLQSLAYSDSLKQTLQSSADIQKAQEQLYQLSEQALDCLFQLWQISKGEQQYAEEALVFFEKSKSDWLRTSAREWLARKYAGIPDSLVEKELALKAQYIYYRKLAQEQGSDHNYKTAVWQKRFVHSKKQLDSLLSRLKLTYPEYYQLKYDQQVVALERIRQYINDQDGQLVTYFWGQDHIYAMGINGRKIQWEKIEDVNCLEKHLEAFAQTVSSGRSNWNSDHSRMLEFQNYISTSIELYDMLLAPVLDSHPIKKLLLVPDGPLGQLPFQILLKERPAEQNLQQLDYRNLPYLIRHTPIQYEHSATLIFQSKQLERQLQNYLGFAPSYQDKQTLATFFSDTRKGSGGWETDRGAWGELTYNRQEIEETAKKTNGEMILGQAATEAAFREKSGSAGILHLAGHAYSHEREADYSALIFSKDPKRPEDGQLYAYELYNLPLQANMAVLSACHTGAGVLRHGEGIMSLSRAFRYAGCPSVMMSLWSANDEATKDIVVTFFERLKEQATKSEALQQATLRFLSRVKTDEMTHPYYWGNFVVVGQDDPLKFQADSIIPKSLVMPILVISLVVLSGLGWYWRKAYSGSSFRIA